MSDNVIARANMHVNERTLLDEQWYVRYTMANDLYRGIKARDSLVENAYRRNEAWTKYPELIIDEAYVHSERNQISNFVGAFHYKKFVNMEHMRTELKSVIDLGI